jgi:uncharacterized protein YbaR (Trm112 family)
VSHDAAKPSNRGLEDLDEFLRCPWTGSKLRILSSVECELVNQRLLGGKVYNHAGRRITEPFTAGLVNSSGSWAYRLSEGVPQMLRGEALSLDGIPLGIIRPCGDSS